MFWGSRIFLPLFVALVFLCLYIPIIILVIFSFNKVAFPYRWEGFSWQWYQVLFQSTEIWQATKNSLIIASFSAFLSLLLSLLWVFYGHQQRLQKLNKIFMMSIAVPEIILALGLLSLFSFFSIPLDLFTIIAGHTVLGLAYAMPLLNAQFYELDFSVIEASLDLGATLHQTFFKVVLPNLGSTLIAAGLLIFIISLDDFLITFFCSGGGAQTLSLYIFSMIRTGISPTVNALSTLLLLASSTVVLIFSLLKIRTRVY